MPFISFPFSSSFSYIYFSSHFFHFSYLKHYYCKKVGVLEPPQPRCSAGPVFIKWDIWLRCRPASLELQRKQWYYIIVLLLTDNWSRHINIKITDIIILSNTTLLTTISISMTTFFFFWLPGLDLLIEVCDPALTIEVSDPASAKVEVDTVPIPDVQSDTTALTSHSDIGSDDSACSRCCSCSVLIWPFSADGVESSVLADDGTKLRQNCRSGFTLWLSSTGSTIFCVLDNISPSFLISPSGCSPFSPLSTLSLILLTLR